MDQETELLTNAFASHEKILKVALDCILPNPKNSEVSEKVRKEGNAVFSRKNHSHESLIEILNLYNRSASLAPKDSQKLASAYANRSAFLLYVGKYAECIQDIQKAMKIAESSELKVKLLCRQVECLKNLGINAYYNLIEKAQSLVNEIEDGKTKQMLQRMIEKVGIEEIGRSVVKKAENICKRNETIDVTDSMLEKVSIKYSEKYGRHLVAEQNYEPGDIILVEKIFTASVYPTHQHIICHHCLEICWSGVPCDRCDWAIFCSEECSKSAWSDYHDIECSVGQLLNRVLDIPWNSCSITLKILIKALKEVGSVAGLKGQLEAVDRCADVCTKGFYKDGIFAPNTIESFYSLTKMQFSESETERIPLVASLILIGLLNHPQLKNIYHVKEVKDLNDNEDIVFLGSLIIKLTAILFNNHFPIFGVIPTSSRGFCVASLLSLVNHSCCPNANVRFTKDGKAILHVLQPLEKDSQIFIPYNELQYYTICLNDRKKALQRNNFECDCQACTDSWPTVLLNCKSETDVFDGDDSELMKKICMGTAELMHKNDFKAELEKLKPKVSLAYKNLKQPSALTCALQIMINDCIENIYNVFKPQTVEKFKSSK